MNAAALVVAAALAIPLTSRLLERGYESNESVPRRVSNARRPPPAFLSELVQAEAGRCFDNQVSIARALTRYRVFNKCKVDSLTPEVLRMLAAEHYLPRVPGDPGLGNGSLDRYRLGPHGIACTLHGTLPASRMPSAQTLELIRSTPCYRWQFNIATAVLRYNLGHNLRVTRLDGELFGKLVELGYLSALPEDPGQGPGSQSNFVLTSDGSGIACVRHGACPPL